MQIPEFKEKGHNSVSLHHFDHFIILVNDLAAAIETYHALGFDVRAGGEHPAFGSHNALVALADGAYLELLGFRDAARAEESFWSDAVKMLRVKEGFGGFALASNDLAGDVAQLRKAALDVADPNTGSRTRPDGQRVEWQAAIVGGTPSGALPFLIQDVTPRELRVEPAKEGLGKQARVKEVVVAVKRADVSRDAYRALLGVEPRRVHNTAGDVTGYRFSLPWGTIIVAHPESAGNAMADQVSIRGEGLYALTLVMEDANPARRVMKTRNIKVEDETYGFLISADAACGARIRLLQA
ncbi:MAG: VOC family protein [Chloroflexota bacterium]|nr:VOC family protein [Chloroflexota bacterium]